MYALIIILTAIAGAVFGIIIKALIDEPYFKEVYYLWDEDRRDRDHRARVKEARLLKELSRLQVRLSEYENDIEPRENDSQPFTITNIPSNNLFKADDYFIDIDFPNNERKQEDF